MYKTFLSAIAALTMIYVPLDAQTYQRRATVGNGNPESGKCTIEVVVDGAAEVEISGDNANLRNLNGQPAQWRRFECTSRMPNNPMNFRFQGIDGRGRQDLVRAPANGGPAVVHIEDKSGGAEGYTFDIMWSGGGYYNQSPVRPGYDQPIYRDPYAGIWGGGQPARDEAIRVCRNEIRERAAQRFGTPYLSFQNMRLDDNPDRRDWVMGTFTLRGRPHQFACSVNFDSGRVRWAEIDPPGGRWSGGSASRQFDAVQNCRAEVMNRARQRGLYDLQFGPVNVDNNPGRNDWVIGSLRGSSSGFGAAWFDFSCRVDLSNGDVRMVDLNGRR